MKPTWSQSATLSLGALALLCWVVMFLAGTDVWHEIGRPDFWRLQGPPYTDLWAFAYAFYLLPLCLAGQVIAAVVSPRQAPGARWTCWNSPSTIGTATFSMSVKTRNPTAKTPAATRSSVIEG
jgi:hypothetical protein